MRKTSPPAFSPTRLAQAREAAGLSNADLALQVGARRQEVVRWQNQNSPRTPRPEMQKRLAEALEIEVTALFDPAPVSLAALRKAHGLRQEDLAERAGIPRSTVQALETGKIATLRPEYADSLANVLGVSPGEIQQAHQAGLTEDSTNRSSGPAAHLRKVLELADGALQLAPVLELSADLERQATSTAQELRAEAGKPQPDQGRLHQLLDELSQALKPAPPTAGKQAVLRLISAAARSLST